MTIIDFDVESEYNCDSAEFRIYDGNVTSSSRLLLDHCGEQMPNKTSFVSTNNQMLIIFRTTRTVGSKGFKLSYETVI